jgi:hypothetical protein
MNDSEARHYFSERLALLPPKLRRAVDWLLQPESRWLRWPAGFLLILGGMLWFLPVLGLWMLPLGLFLIAEDIPALKRWLARVFNRCEVTWRRWRRG